MDLHLRLTLLAAAPLVVAFPPRGTDPSLHPRPVAADSVPGWAVGARPGHARLERDTVEKHGGTAAGRLIATPQPMERPPAGQHGPAPQGPMVAPIYLTQALNAQPYRQRRVRASLWIKTKLPEKAASRMPVSRVQAFMRIENEDGTYTVYDGSISPMVGSTEWTRKVIVLEVPSDAYALGFGIAVTGPGEVWVDDVVLEDQGPAMGTPEKRPMMPGGPGREVPPEALERAKAMLERAKTRAATRPTEVVNGDFEGR
jgi:hypothetical protein